MMNKTVTGMSAARYRLAIVLLLIIILVLLVYRYLSLDDLLSFVQVIFYAVGAAWFVKHW